MEALTTEQQVMVDRLVGEARVKAREKAQVEFTSAQNGIAEAAEMATLAADAEWKTLNEKNEARVRELEPFEAQAKEYNALISKMLRTKVKSLGDGAKTAVDGLPEGMSTAAKLKWLTANEALFGDVSSGVGTPRRKLNNRGKPGDNTPKERPLRL